jgi:glycerol kinase
MTNDAGRAGSLVLALDEGTTNAKAVLVDPARRAVVATASRPVGIAFPAPGWVEQDAEEIWEATRAAAAEVLAAAGDQVPVALAISNQRESVVAWSRSTGRTYGPVLGWQDARTAEACAALTDVQRTEVRRRTGLPVDPMYSAPKMAWLAEAALADGADPDDLVLGTVDAFLVHRLTGVLATEAGNASRTLLLDLETLDWHPGLLDVFGVEARHLPPVRHSDAGFGATRAVTGIPAGIPVVAVLADSHAALLAHGCAALGTGKATYGTGSSVMTPVGGLGPAPEGVTTTVAWVADGTPTYAREGNILATGAALEWTASLLGLAGGAEVAALAEQATHPGQVHLVPAFAGLGAPTWDRSATGLLSGITAGTTRADIARAAVDAVAQQVADVIEAVEADGRARIDVLRADGGATASALLVQRQADLLGRPVAPATAPEASALGAALLAARTLGLPVADPVVGARVEPRLAPGERTADRAAWRDAVSRSRGLTVNPGRTV